jgi:hypothetical protein
MSLSIECRLWTTVLTLQPCKQLPADGITVPSLPPCLERADSLSGQKKCGMQKGGSTTCVEVGCCAWQGVPVDDCVFVGVRRGGGGCIRGVGVGGYRYAILHADRGSLDSV